MIRSFAELRQYQRADRAVVENGRMKAHNLVLMPNYRFVWLLRVGEYTRNCWTTGPQRVLGALVRFLIRRHGWKYGFSIPWNVFGPGLWLFHVGTIIVNSGVVVGERCSIHADVVIGRQPGVDPDARSTPILGDSCWIGPGAKIFGGIELGDRTMVGANAVVTKDVPAGMTVAGVPARILGPNTREAKPSLLP